MRQRGTGWVLPPLGLNGMPPDPGARLSQDSVSTASDPTLDDDEDATRLLTDEWIAEQDIESVPLDTLSHEQDHPRRNSSMRAITHPSRFSPLRGLLVMVSVILGMLLLVMTIPWFAGSDRKLSANRPHRINRPLYKAHS